MSVQVVAGLAGALGPIAFISVLTLAGTLREGYDPVSRYVSDLAVGENGWIQTANFIAFGCLVIIFVRGLPRAVIGGNVLRASTALLMLTGVGLILLGVFPTDLGHEASTAHGAGHFVASILTFGALVLALVLIPRQLSRDPRWAACARYSAINGVVVAGLCLAAVAAAPPAAFNDFQAGPLASWSGLMQRALFLAAFGWFAVMGLRLLALSRAGSRLMVPPAAPSPMDTPARSLSLRSHRRKRAVRERASRSSPRAA